MFSDVERNLLGCLWDHHLRGDPWGREVQLHQRDHPLPSLLALLLDPGIICSLLAEMLHEHTRNEI